MKERSFMFRRRRIWFYPYRKMNINHLKPKTIIKGFLYSRPMVGGKSYFIDFGLFKISIGAKQMTYKEWKDLSKNFNTYDGKKEIPHKVLVGNFNFRDPMREDLERKEHRENCPSRTQYQFGKGKRKFVCLDADKDCNSKVRCRYMDNYDAEQGITHRKDRGEDFYD